MSIIPASSASLLFSNKDNIIGVVAENLYGIEYALNRGLKVIGGPGLNIYNSYAAKWYGLSNYVESVEASFIGGYTMVSDKIMVMTLTHCPIQLSTKCTCNNCKYENNSFYKNGSLTIQIERVKVGYCYFNLFIDNPKLVSNLTKKYIIKT